MRQPERVGRYRVIAELGRGGMGVVFRALDPVLGREVALKTVLLDQVAEPSTRGLFRDRLFREAMAAAKLAHPGIVPVYDVVQDAEFTGIVMGYVKGVQLSEILAREVLPDLTFTLRFLGETAAALDHAHRKGVVHRDIKPANIMIDHYSAVKIMDFGVAKLAESAPLTQTGFVVGTPEYMSPEQITGQKVDGRSDQFSLGVIAYQMLTGHKPFTAESLIALSFKIVQQEPQAPQELNPKLPDQAQSVLATALAKAAGDRYETCSAFVAALGAVLKPTPSCQETRTPDEVLHVSPKHREAEGKALARTPAVLQAESSPPPPEPFEIRLNARDRQEYVWLPPGSFQMGSSSSDDECDADEKPQHLVTLTKGFWMGQTEITVSAYRAFVQSTARKMPVAPVFDSDWKDGECPIVNVSWNDAVAYCQWAGGSLPSEAQWEYAARGGKVGQRYPWGTAINPQNATYSAQRTAPAKQFEPNDYKLFDMVGNVWEWCIDWYGEQYYQTSPSIDPVGPPSGRMRVVRGGAWINRPKYLRLSYRNKYEPELCSEVLGVRCVCGVLP